MVSREGPAKQFLFSVVVFRLCVCGCLARKTLWYPNKSRCLACVKSLAFFYTRCVCVLCYYSNTPTHNNNDGQVVLAVYSNGAQVDARLISHDSLVIDYYLQVPPRRLFSKKKKIFSLFFPTVYFCRVAAVCIRRFIYCPSRPAKSNDRASAETMPNSISIQSQ